MTITVCIPAYRAGDFIARTLDSVAKQTHGDFRVTVAVDPVETDAGLISDNTAEAVSPFLKDRRFSMYINPERYGWAGNIRELLKRVDTPLFAILPHDDLWHPRYLETLYGALQSHPGAMLAYTDFLSFGNVTSRRKSVVIPYAEERDPQTRAFLLEGAEAMPWRGLTSSALLRHIDYFPTDEFMGYAVECEYALSLVEYGPVVHVPEPLYFKRIFASGKRSASRDRFNRQNHARLELAWSDFGRHMHHRLRERRDEVPEALRLALESALIRRRQLDLGGRLTTATLEQVNMGLVKASEIGDSALSARFNLAMSRHWSALKDTKTSLQFAEQAFDHDGSYVELLLWLAELYLLVQQPFQAATILTKASSLRPQSIGQPGIYEKLSLAF